MLSKILENFRMALSALMNNKTRSALTMLGITIGVGSVILLMSVGHALEEFVVYEFSNFGSDLVMITGKASNEVFDQLTADEMDMFEPLTDADVAALKDPDNVPDALVVAGAVGVSDSVFYDGQPYQPQVAGITPDYFTAFNYQIGLGESITWDHVNSAARVAVIGQETVAEMFDGRYPIGEFIRIRDVSFEVIGVWDEIKTAVDPQVNNIVVIPLTTIQQRIIGERTITGDYPIMTIAVKATGPDTVDAVVEQVYDTMRRSHNLASDEKDDFVVLSQNQILDTLEQVTSLLTTFLGVIAGISLLVGGIGIMNIMLVTVTERTREIGVRKALGAQRSDILTQFLIEAITLSMLGGAVGIIIAATFSLLTSALVPTLDVTVQMSSILIATSISFMVGTFFGAYPANRAARLNPIDALRYE